MSTKNTTPVNAEVKDLKNGLDILELEARLETVQIGDAASGSIRCDSESALEN
ncbi:hypothetical protein H7F33_17610 [Pedobacter sp. PAMC26386]|nr:hypothetical protein H7F33_17585 [Pedobacter sp. PAMC26386]QNK62334.1 hypothetical protein H7F33_17590 [Pedobacter sp. PAMC26386]QNK62335.1 hypothetical protein H7F33_17595 [Pedobacter sp. PAMC26386]QNK62336.1 hypothetical protein H7F33_17600 [Pedobacter sp. PAMC26386]QNK62337.1 hypothetical protein H7F33_17605 [Pedobacter sp. PAMC26386]